MSCVLPRGDAVIEHQHQCASNYFAHAKCDCEAVSEIDKNEVVRMLVAVTRKVGYALDGSEEIEGDDGRAHAISGQSFDDLCDALAALDELPDDKPGCIMNAADKAEWALRSASDSQQWDDLPKKLMRAARREALTNEDRVAIGRAIARMEMIDGEQKRSAALRAKLDWAYTEIERLKMVERHPDPLHLSRILHELAGAASLCWEPRPTGVFDSQMAIQFVEQAIADIRSRMTTAPAEVPSTKVATEAFELWWANEGQFCRAGGGEYEKTFAFRGYEAGIAASPLRALAQNFEVTGPDADGLLWLVLHGHGTTGSAMFNLGRAGTISAEVLLMLEADRRAALRGETTA